MIRTTFRGVGAPPAKAEKNSPQAGCKCGRCTRSDERSDSVQASSDLGGG